MGSGFEPAPLSGVSLSGIELFAELDTEIRQKVASRCHGRRYQPRSRILASDEQSSDVFFIVSGDVRVTYYSASGKEVNFRDQHAGQMFGEIAAIDGMGRSAYVMAMSETLLASMSQEHFLHTMTDHPEVAVSCLRHLTGLVRKLTDRVIEFSTLGVRNRIHAELLRLAIEAATSADDVAVTITPAPKHADTASRVSTHREAVTRELSDLARAGLVERGDNSLTVCDLAELRRLVADVGRT